MSDNGEQPKPQSPVEPKRPDWPPKGVDKATVEKLIDKLKNPDQTPSPAGNPPTGGA